MGRIFFDEVFRSFAQFLIGLFLYLLPLRPTTAKSLQSCLTLCDPVDCSLPGSSIHGIFQARVVEWGAIALAIHNFPRLNEEEIENMSRLTENMSRSETESLI